MIQIFVPAFDNINLKEFFSQYPFNPFAKKTNGIALNLKKFKVSKLEFEVQYFKAAFSEMSNSFKGISNHELKMNSKPKT
ncbi:MAG: hypothetical protein N2747_08730 [Chitinophagaceae bacterium]|nr:hypothetical protein [Chitinophagaceae bacterium]